MSINLFSFDSSVSSSSSNAATYSSVEEAVKAAEASALQANIAPEAVEALEEAKEVKEESALLKKQGHEALDRAQQIEKATEALEGAYEGLDKAEAFAAAALEKELAAKAKLAALRQRRQAITTPVEGVVATSEESEYKKALRRSVGM